MRSIRLQLLLTLALAACTSSAEPSVFARNPLTGETRSFADESQVPEGWDVCPDDGCAALEECDSLIEASCLARVDCSPTYDDNGRFQSCGGSAQTCNPDDCGPALGLPNWECEDGTIGGPTGRCLANEDSCGWEVRECPSGPTPMCEPEDCGPAIGAAWRCDDGSMGGPTGRCLPTDDGCGWEIRECPDVTCEVEDCGPAIGASWMCDDGSMGGPTGRCLPTDDGCGWEIRECPDSDAECMPEECGPAPGAPNFVCDDGSVGGPVCNRTEGACGWSIRECPEG